MHGSNNQIYADRLELLRPFFTESDNLFNNIKIIDTRCNVIYIITKLLEDAPSAMEITSCSNIHCLRHKHQQKSSPTIILYN